MRKPSFSRARPISGNENLCGGIIVRYGTHSHKYATNKTAKAQMRRVLQNIIPLDGNTCRVRPSEPPHRGDPTGNPSRNNNANIKHAVGTH